MNAMHKIIERAVSEASQLASRSSGELLMEVSRRLPPNAEIKLYRGKMRVQHNYHFDDLFTAEAVDEALATNLELFG